jgi:hypothetical protein
MGTVYDGRKVRANSFDLRMADLIAGIETWLTLVFTVSRNTTRLASLGLLLSWGELARVGQFHRVLPL